MPIVDAIVMEMEQEAKTTRRVLQRIPENKLGWKPHAKSFTLGQLAMHIAGGQKQIAKMANEDVWEVGDFSVPEANSCIARNSWKLWTKARAARNMRCRRWMMRN